MLRNLGFVTLTCTALVVLAAADTPAPDAPSFQPPASATEILAGEIETFRSPGTLKTALAELAELAGVPIEVDWESLRAIGLTEETKIVLRADHQTAEGILRLIFAEVTTTENPARWVADGQVVRVTAGAPSAPPADVAAPQRTDLTFRDTPLVDVVNTLRTAGNLDVLVEWPALEASGVTPQTPVNVDVPGPTLRRTLDMITEGLSAGMDKYSGVYWVADDGLVRITTGRALNGELQAQVFDVGDLLMTVPDFQSPRFDIGRLISSDPGAGDFWTEPEPDDDQLTGQDARQALIETVKGLLDPDLWTDGGGKGSVRIVGDRLIVSQTQLGWLLMSASR